MSTYGWVGLAVAISFVGLALDLGLGNIARQLSRIASAMEVRNNRGKP